MHPDLEKLLDLQSKDLALKAVDMALADVLAAETALDDRLERAEHEVETTTRSAAETATRRDELMRRVEEYKVQQQRRQQRLDQVKNMKEANAVTAEIDLGRQVLAREEAEWLQVAEELGRLDTKQAAAEAGAGGGACGAGRGAECPRAPGARRCRRSAARPSPPGARARRGWTVRSAPGTTGCTTRSRRMRWCR